MHFCALGYSRPGNQPRPEGGATSDHWLDVEKLVWEPEFYTYVRDAFAPVGIMIDAWAEEYSPGARVEFPIALINDLYEDWQGTVRLRLLREGKVLREKTEAWVVPALGSRRLSFALSLPRELGAYQVEAALLKPGCDPVRSLRDFKCVDESERQARMGIAVGKSVQASSYLARAGATAPAAVTDGRLDSRWSSEFADPQWIAIDLGKTERISRVILDWEAAYARVYTLEVSLDGKAWKEIYRTSQGKGGSEKIDFAPAEARWVRLTGTKRATSYGYSLWEFRVFRAQ
jgi:hypothetical protein